MLEQYALMYSVRILLHYRCIKTKDMKMSVLQIGEREDFILWKSYYNTTSSLQKGKIGFL